MIIGKVKFLRYFDRMCNSVRDEKTMVVFGDMTASAGEGSNESSAGGRWGVRRRVSIGESAGLVYGIHFCITNAFSWQRCSKHTPGILRMMDERYCWTLYLWRAA